MTTRPIIDTQATCSCGATTLTVKGPVLSMLLCACLDCQKETGTGHSAVALVKAVDVTTSGTLLAFSRPAASGATTTRHFCPQCGVTLYAQSSRAPQTMLVPAGLLGGDWFNPNQVIFARSHTEWDTLPETIPHYETYREGL
ncbi:GFA family protein [Pelagibacterium xiamenense]|uniref:GFA family protein n=1 Tax=Pelagibacterium xiamenense TaxID=2901140 RepID=UPI001E586098|nr:GFA family protein [Pelagibacterium xiamenense]MCD7059980.1 GFA family protein [Pelagibacterium xiamenense]